MFGSGLDCFLFCPFGIVCFLRLFLFPGNGARKKEEILPRLDSTEASVQRALAFNVPLHPLFLVKGSFSRRGLVHKDESSKPQHTWNIFCFSVKIYCNPAVLQFTPLYPHPISTGLKLVTVHGTNPQKLFLTFPPQTGLCSLLYYTHSTISTVSYCHYHE